MRESLIDLVGLHVGEPEFLSAVLENAAQPIWVADHDGTIRFANPAALRALGCDRAEELAGRDSYQAIHGTSGTATEWPVLRPLVSGQPVVDELDWFVRSDGSRFQVSYNCAPIDLPQQKRGVIVVFTSVDEREQLVMLPREPEALHRVATMVAEVAPPEELFAAVTEEIGHLLRPDAVTLARYESGGGVAAAASWTADGAKAGPAGHRLASRILEAGRPVRMNDENPGPVYSVGSPIVADGRVWGHVAVHSTAAPCPPGTERRLAQFADLLSTAIQNADAHAQLQRLANEQAALRRVATLVARERPPAEVFAAVTEEVGRLLAVEVTTMHRYEDDGATIVASWGERGGVLRVGERIPVDGENVTAIVYRTCKPARIDNYAAATGELAEIVRKRGVRAAVACPIVVDGRLWGAMVAAHRRPAPLPVGTESRIAQFTELIATAIANVQARSDLAASRARIVAATDEERRRVVRDLHDGAQQRLVHTVITLKLAREAMRDDLEGGSLLVTQALEQCQQAMAELRELAHGILPTVLTRGGLRAGADALADRMPVPVEVEVSVDRLPPRVEATAFFVLSEALTNVAKHAHAQRVGVSARVRDDVLELVVRDDGGGGAKADGSGLVGLADRVAVLDGLLRVDSPEGGGTVVTAVIPLESQAGFDESHRDPPAKASAPRSRPFSG